MPSSGGDLPYIAIGNNELGGPLLDTVPCPHCGEMRPVEKASGERTVLQYVNCGGHAYLVGVNGRGLSP